MENSIEKDLRDFIINSFLFGDATKKLGNEDSFLEKGIIDSTGVVHLVTFVEEKYAIRIDDAEIMPENLDTINNLINFIQKKLLDKNK